jgi:hypothetical protein
VTLVPSTIIGLNAVIVAIAEETPRILVVRRAEHALATSEQRGGPPAAGESPDALPFGPFEPERHRTLELGLREWVEAQTGFRLGYAEQLYTFGDRYRDPRELAGGPRVVSVGYIALVREAPLSGTGDAQWRDWYEFLPWEDWRDRRPPAIDELIRPRLQRWIDMANDPDTRRARRDRVAITFGFDDAGWDFERVLDRHELLYEAGLVAEAWRDRQASAGMPGAPLADRPPPAVGESEIGCLPGQAMALDHRRILATALGRLRGKLRYRPVVFELLPRDFTLSRLQGVVEALTGVGLHKQNFRRLVIQGKLVEPTGQRESHTGGRPAELFRFRREVLRERLAPGVGVPALRLSG